MKALLFLSVFLSTTALAGLADVIDCNDNVTTDLNRVANHAADNWADVEDFMEDYTGINVKNCMKNRFKKNGKIVCEQKNTGRCDGALGWASPFNKKAHFCPTAISNFEALARTPDQRACYFALMVHEFAHSCDRGEAKAEELEDAAFAYWASTHNVTVDPNYDCGFD